MTTDICFAGIKESNDLRLRQPDSIPFKPHFYLGLMISSLEDFDIIFHFLSLRLSACLSKSARKCSLIASIRLGSKPKKRRATVPDL